MCILPCTGWRGGFGRQGLKLSQQAIANWLLNISKKWLQPIYDTLREQLCKEPVLHKAKI